MHKDMTWSNQWVKACIYSEATELKSLVANINEAVGLGLEINKIKNDGRATIAEFSAPCSLDEFVVLYRKATELGWS